MYRIVLCCCVKGEGVAYRGRVLVELETVLDEMPVTPVEDISADDVLQVQVPFHFVVFADSMNTFTQRHSTAWTNKIS